MKIIKVDNIKGTDRAVKFNCGMVSNRILLESDGMGYSLTKTEVPKGDWRHWHYKNHLETCYCISGSGMLYDRENRVTHEIKPGIVYILDAHDDHDFLAVEDTVLICIFNPPLTGKEIHDDDGSYIASDR